VNSCKSCNGSGFTLGAFGVNRVENAKSIAFMTSVIGSESRCFWLFWLGNNNSDRLGGFATCESITCDGSTRTRMFPRARTSYMDHLVVHGGRSVHVFLARK